MKSLKAQLIAAIAMTLVAALTIGSSTYAWFTMNTTVEAKAMKVKATSSSGLNIFTWNPTVKDGSATGWVGDGKTAYSYHSTNKVADMLTLEPVSTSTFDTWWNAEAAKGDDAKGKADESTGVIYTKKTENITYNPKIKSDDTNFKNYYSSGLYLYDIYEIKTASGKAESKETEDLTLNLLKATATTTTSGDLNKAIRVALRVSIAETITAPDYDKAKTYAKGDLCTYEKQLYKCTTAITTPEEWTAAHWAAEDPTKFTQKGIYVMAPNYTGASDTYPATVQDPKIVGGTASATAVAAFGTGITTKTVVESGKTLQLTTGTAAETIVEVFIYYDGEDSNCRSDRTAFGVDAIDVELQFGQS